MVTKPARRMDAANIVLLILLTALCFSMLYPFLNILFISVSDMSDVMESGGLLLYPKSVNWDSYRYVLRYNGIADAYRNTIFITAVGTTLALILTTLGAYVLARKDLPGNGLMTTFVVVTMFFGGGLIPSYLNIRNLGLLNSLWVLILPSCISTWNMLLERNFMMAIPGELCEAARIDGAGEVRTLLRIILPLSMPILATLALFYGVARWNEYASAIIYISKQKLYTLQVIIHRMYTMSISDVLNDENVGMPPTEAIRSATVMFATVPILCVYPFLQKYFAQGLMVGSVKG